MPDAGESIVKRLKELGISRLDYVVYSHDPDFFTDSVTIALPDYKAALARCHLEPVMLWDGMSFDIGAGRAPDYDQ